MQLNKPDSRLVPFSMAQALSLQRTRMVLQTPTHDPCR